MGIRMFQAAWLAAAMAGIAGAAGVAGTAGAESLADLAAPSREASVAVRAAGVGEMEGCTGCIRVAIPEAGGTRHYFVERAARCELHPGDVREVAHSAEGDQAGMGLLLEGEAHARLVACLAAGPHETDLVLVADRRGFLSLTFFDRSLPVLRLLGSDAARDAARRLQERSSRSALPRPVE